MSDYRLSKDTSARYTSLEDLRESFGLKPFSKKTKDVNKLKSQQEKFQGKCRCCGKPMTYIVGTNTVVCQNKDCKGMAFERTDAEGNKYTFYVPVVKILDEKGFEIAMTLFS